MDIMQVRAEETTRTTFKEKSAVFFFRGYRSRPVRCCGDTRGKAVTVSIPPLDLPKGAVSRWTNDN